MFFSQPKSIFILYKNSIIFLNSHIRSVVDFPPIIVNNLKILDQHKFEQTFISFLASLPTKPHKASIILAKEVIAIKQFENSDVSQNLILNFFETLPIPDKQLITKQVQSVQQTTIYATNKTFFLSFVDILKRLNWQIDYVIPSIFDETILEDKTLPPKKLIATIFKQPKLFSVNFLDTTLLNYVISNRHMTKYFKLLPLFFIPIIFTPIIIYLLAFGYQSTPPPNTIIPPSKSTPILSTQITASPVITDKTQVNINILNASNKSGQAAKLKETLTSLGYNNISTGNASSSAQLITDLKIKNSLATEIKQEIYQLVDSLYQNIQQSTPSADFSYDIQIIIGR